MAQGKKRDLTNEQFGDLTVIKEVENEGKVGSFWLCKCKCGNTTIVRGGDLKRKKNCGCGRKTTRNDLTGQTFGKLKVVKYVYTKDKRPYYECLCECGGTKIAQGKLLKNGHITSCGCSTGNKQNLIGKQFGRLTVEKLVGQNKYNSQVWLCSCECGGHIEVATKDLNVGHVQSCGCFNSRGNTTIQQTLETLKEKFISEYRVKIKDYFMRYDFYLPSYKLIIEYDGEGHYEPIDFAGKGKEWANKNFERIKKYDNLKNDYCKENNLSLLRIPYWEFNNIKEIIYQEIEKLKTFNDYPVKE